MKSILVFIILFTIAFYSIGQEWVNISPFESSVGSIGIDFISATEGWAWAKDAEYNQILMYTNDGGMTWDSIYACSSFNHWYIIDMVDNEYGHMSNSEHPYCLFRTMDGGYTWEDITDTTTMWEYGLIGSTRTAYFVNRDTGFCMGRKQDSWDGEIYKTVDGGESWYPTVEYVHDSLPSYDSFGVKNFDFIDNDNGWAGCSRSGGSGCVIRTYDGGETWYLKQVRLYNSIIDVWDENHGGTAGCSDLALSVLISNDGFDNVLFEYFWGFIIPMPSYICYQNSSTIWITGNSNSVVRSVDGGENFEIFQTIQSPNPISLGMIQFHGNTGYIGCTGNYLLKFEDTLSVAINEPYELHKKEYLSIQSFPNPFNGETCITYNTTEAGNVELSIYNIKGQLVELLDNGFKEKGGHTITWDTEARGINVASGIYFIKLNTKNKSKLTKVLFLK